jgi:hypothetical protein
MVIPARAGKRLLRQFKKERWPTLLNLGHRLLHPATVEHLGEKGIWMPAVKP